MLKVELPTPVNGFQASGLNLVKPGFMVDGLEVGGINQEPGTQNPVFMPFAAVAGYETARHALLLLAVEPELRGAIIASESGSANSVLARGFAATCMGVPPRAPLLGTSKLDGAMRGARGGTRLHGQFGSQAIELPLGVTEDRLLGGLDLERTLATGNRQVSRGLLAQSDGQVLYVDSINLLQPEIANHLAHALDSRLVFVERESVSATHSADFVLVATFNPAEGEANALLRDRVGLIVESLTDSSTDQRADIIERDLRFEKDPAGLTEEFAFETAQIKQAIEAGRERLPRVRVSNERRRQIAQIAMRLGVEGNRADVFALKAARANAALAGRDAIEDEDIVVAIQLVLAPRATTVPREVEPAETQPEASQEHDRNNELENHDSGDSFSAGIEEVVIAAIDSRVTKDLIATAQKRSRASDSGKRFAGSTSTRGRYVSSSLRRNRDARVAIDATLRAAAPFQRWRRLADMQVEGPHHEKGTAPAARVGRRVKVQPGDLRYKSFKHRSGIMFIFAVDASGSMALNRMAQAKGALTRLLSEAYLHRDKVALISFRGSGAEVSLAPTRSVELAKRLVDAMPAGGGTPIAAGVLKAIELARHARLQGLSQAMVVLFTDGRANVRLCNERAIEDELKQLGALLRTEGISTVVVDTKARFLSNSEGRAISTLLEARYLCLAQSSGETAYRVVRDAARDSRTLVFDKR
jgi:magnesium chelatase subunit D